MKKFQRFFENAKSLLSPSHLGVYILLSAVIWSFFYYQSRLISFRGTVSVTGVAYQDVKADSATWQLEISHKDVDRKVSYQRLLEDEKQIRDFLKSEHIIDEEIGQGSYDTKPVYKKINDYQTTDQIVGYESKVSFWVTSPDVNKIYSTNYKMNGFAVTHDITLSQNQASYVFTGLDNLKVLMLEEALKDAKLRAEALNQSSGTSVGKVIKASQGIFQVSRPDDYTVSDYGNFDTTSINKRVRALVNVDFELR